MRKTMDMEIKTTKEFKSKTVLKGATNIKKSGKYQTEITSQDIRLNP